jgi:hypothetical protein
MTVSPVSIKPALVLLLLLFSFYAHAYVGGIRGVVRGENNEVLAFATLFVKETGTGVTTNVNGEFELSLPEGEFTIIFQFLGYETLVRKLQITSSMEVIDVTLVVQPTLLREVTVSAEEEDPAYSIMRKAIAKANYHRNYLDSYSARVYIKGAMQLKDYPWLAARELKKEGIEKGRVYLSETVSELTYIRPNTYKEKVISIRTDGKDKNVDPTPFIYGSFYDAEIAETISPLSPKAFSYYKFEYQGTFKDRTYDVSRIKVTPRSKGDNVIEGTIFIIEDWWSIHSLDVRSTKLGISFDVKMVYAPIDDKAWLPVSYRFKGEGKIFGFEFEIKYLATLADYKIKINPELYVDPRKMEVVDEKVQKQEAKEIQKKHQLLTKSQTGKSRSKNKTHELQQRLEDGKEITRKELKQVMKEYEKEEQKQQKEPEVILNNEVSIDSNAYKRDSSYWETVRPVPLTNAEVKGYEKLDSMAEVYRKREAGDTLKNSRHQGFQLWDLVIGDHYRVSKNSHFKIYFPMGGFNTVEGWNLNYKFGFGTVFQDSNKTRLNITPTFRYAFSREKLSGNLRFTLRNKKQRLDIEGGRFVQQLNHDRPIHPIINSLTTLLLERNLMKLYERDYAQVKITRQVNNLFSVTTDWSFAKRYPLENSSDWKLVDRDHIAEYSSNQPQNEELESTDFKTHEALVGMIRLEARPWLKFRIRNGHKYPVQESSPTFSFEYNKGFSELLGSDVKFDQIEFGVRHRFDVGVRGQVDMALRAGVFLNDDKMYFMDYKHFLGNRTPVTTSDPVGSFRLLPYYLFSTSDKYFAGNVHYKFRKFLVTSIPKLRMMGIRENVFVNYLATPASGNYSEMGYSIDGILRIFRLEGAASFHDGKYLDFGVRLGISTNIAISFED